MQSFMPALLSPSLPRLTCLGLAAACSLVSCNLNDGLRNLGSSLLDPENTQLDVPGRQLLKGKYQQARWDPAIDDAGLLHALTLEDEPHLILLTASNTAQCDAGRADGLFVTIRTHKFGRLLISYLVSPQGDVRDYFFHDENCTEVLDPLRGVAPVPVVWNSGLVFLDSDGQLLLLSGEGKVVTLAEQVTQFAVEYGSSLWALSEQGELWRRDSDADNSTPFATEVKTFHYSDTRLIVEDESAVSSFDFIKDKVFAEACAPLPLSANFSSFSVEYPCGSDQRWRLTAFSPEENWQQVRLPEHLGRSSAIGSLTRDSRAEIALLKPNENSPDWSSLHLAHYPLDETTAEPLPEAAESPIASQQLLEEVVCSGSVCLTSPESGGRVFSLESFYGRSESSKPLPSPLLSDVLAVDTSKSFCPGLLVLSGPSESSTLTCLPKDGGDPLSVVEGLQLPLQPQLRMKLNILLLMNSRELDGQLYTGIVTDGGDLRELEVLPELKIGERVLASEVIPTSAFPLPGIRGFAYLKAGSKNELRAILTDSDLDFHVHDNVSEYDIVDWPTPGLLYTVTSGDDAGIWFAKVR